MTEIIPEDDIKEHVRRDTTCSCNPKVEFHNGIMILSHRAFDGRLLLEELGLPTGKQWLVYKDGK